MAYNLTVAEAASRLGVSSARVYQLIHLDALDAEQIGRIWLVDDAGVSARAAQKPKAGRPKTQPSTSQSRSYILMNRTHEIFEFSYDAATRRFSASSRIIDPARAPFGIVSPRGKRASDKALAYWWKHRAIPSTRDGLKSRLTELGLKSADEIPFESLGLSLSDQYWIKPAGSNIEWRDINFFANEFETGNNKESWIAHTGMNSPDNTSEGELPKQWTIRSGKRVLLKGAEALGQEPFNEVIATELYRRLLSAGEYAPYRLETAHGSPASACACFLSDEEEYIPAYYVRQIMRKPNHLNDYRHYIECCVHLGIEDAELALSKMIVCDDILANHDRHWRNFGIVRNVETLECRIAPLFDSGSSLWCDKPTAALAAGDFSFTTKPFYDDANRQLRLVDDYSWFDPAALEGFAEQAEAILGRAPELALQTELASRAPYVREGIQRRIDRIIRIL